MKLSVTAVALAAGLMWAGCILLIGILNLTNPQYGAGFLTLVSSIYPGLHFTHQWENIVAGTIYAFVDGVIGGFLFAWIYDHFVSATRGSGHTA